MSQGQAGTAPWSGRVWEWPQGGGGHGRTWGTLLRSCHTPGGPGEPQKLSELASAGGLCSHREQEPDSHLSLCDHTLLEQTVQQLL